MNETYNAYRWAFIRMCLRHDWSIEDIYLILGYMKSCRYEKICMSQPKGAEWQDKHRFAFQLAVEELEEMMSAHALSMQEREIIRKLSLYNQNEIRYGY